ncbi:MAG: metallophosphoesterase [Rhodobacteraceae bacterium]|nr:metallophosphoesterase [Paracoccaceae bacterium]NCW04048.1 metallophosphoesterase [Paracoccaceae bacterium]NCW64392.1 metallophosphoesterase [Paracoccaceae bacterium]NCX07453.1 metallophosphoesterase [Paracoccaceae bacterium]
MRQVYLGDIQRPILIFGGAYSNLQATHALIDAAQTHGIPAELCIFTGDSIAYCGNPSETLNLLRDFGCPMIKGNCEIELAAGSDTCGCGFEAGSTCDLLSRGWYDFADQQVSADQRQFMGALPDYLIFTHYGKRYIVLHGGFCHVYQFLFSTTPDQDFVNVINEVERDLGAFSGVVAGHSGIPFQKSIAGVTWFNSGAIGMPAHNGTSTTSYGILDAGSFTIHNLSYDHQTAQNAMINAGLDQGYHTALETGYWPSEDVLPMDLRRSVDNG